MHFTKLQGLGNDFVLVDARDKDRNWPEIATAMCRMHFGIGADGLLLLLDSEKADFRMRVFNPDGSEAEACGNGLRCFVRYIYEQKLIATGTISIETMAGVRSAKLFKDDMNHVLIQVGMGQPEFNPQKIPVALEYGRAKTLDIMQGDYQIELSGRKMLLNFVSMGNPHAICFINEPVIDFPLSDIGPAMEKNALFPRGVNFEIARIINKNRIEMRVWERGAGEALACGSGACAVAIAAQLTGQGEPDIEISLPGGTARVTWHRNEEAFLTGPAEVVFTGDWVE
jgi:diaminopimelate epimerase